MIAILANPADAHARCVAHDLGTSGHRVAFADTTWLGRGAHLTFVTGPAALRRWVGSDGTVIDLEEASAVWHRRYYYPDPPREVRNPDVRRFTALEWSDLVSGLFASIPATFVNEPERQRAAVKPAQLHVAQREGLRIPETLVTSERAHAEAFIERHRGRVIHKALRAMESRVVYTKPWEDSDAAHLGDLALAPAIFQEMIASRREVRATIVGERIFAAEFMIRDGLVDARLDVGVTLTPHRLPDDVERRLIALMRRLGLLLATVDLKITADGEYVFLELNPQGQFLYVERLAGLPICRAVAELLASQAS